MQGARIRYKPTTAPEKGTETKRKMEVLMEADPARLKHRNAFNIASMSFDPEMIYAAIRKHVPDFEMTYQIDPLKQAIADSWPDSLDDSCAREEWDWMPQFDLESMTVDMLEKLRAKLNK